MYLMHCELVILKFFINKPHGLGNTGNTEMAENAGPSTSTKQPDPPRPLISLDAEERRKLLLKSLRPRSFPTREVRSEVSANESRYISQFTSGRWREWIYDSSEDSKPAKSKPPHKVKPHQLVIYGYDLLSDDYKNETDMIKKWNLVERDQHFPNLEKGYMEKRQAKNQIKSQADDLGDPLTNPCQDAAMEERQNSLGIAEKALETSPGSSKNAPSTSQASLHEPSQDVVMEECKESPQTSQESSEKVKESDGIMPEVGQESRVTVPESSQKSPVIATEACRKSSSKSVDVVPSETSGGQKTSGDLEKETDKEFVSKDSKSDAMDSSAADSKGPSKLEIEASEATLRGKRKAHAAASSKKEHPEEKKTKKTSATKNSKKL